MLVMATHILHLSDIHTRAADSDLIKAADLIVASTQEQFYSARNVHVVTTGDIAFSGSQEEYGIASLFFEALRSSFGQRLPEAAVHFAFCPGNHDCDFSASDAVRRALIPQSATTIDAGQSLDPAIAAILLSPQKNYASFVGKFATAHEPSPYQKIELAGIDFHVFNSALLSQLKEQAGTLRLQLPREIQTTQNLSVTIFHHPPNWMSLEHAKLLRKAIEKYSDLVLTGHEHEGDAYSLSRSNRSTLYAEGHALWGERTSAFQAISIPIGAQSAAIVEYLRTDDGRRYETKHRREMSFVRTRRGSGGVLSFDFEHQLQTCGTEFSHRRANSISFHQLYVPGELQDRSLAQSQKKTPKYVSTEELPALLDKHSRIAIAGDERSGKSTLAKRLFSQLYDRGSQPLLLSGRSFSSIQDHEILAEIRSAAAKQYSDPSGEHYQQLSRARRVAVIDDAHLSKLSTKNFHKLLAKLHKLFHQSIIIIDDLFSISMLTTQDERGETWLKYQLFVMAEFGRVLRGRLIERWHEIGADDDETPDIEKRIAESEQMLNAIFGRGVVPSYPLFILTSLQLAEIKQGTSASGSICFTYEHLAAAALNRAVSPYSPDTVPTFAAWLAFKMLVTDRRQISLAVVGDVVTEFNAQIGVEMEKDIAIGVLENAGLLVREDDSVRFAYKYAYYYYAAKHIQANLENAKLGPVISKKLAEMAQGLHVDDNANVILFVLYLTKNEQLILKLIEQAETLYADANPCRMEEDVKHISVQLLPAEAVGRPRQEREALRESEDAEQERRAEESKDLDIVLKMNTAIRTLEMLGQILRNSPGSITAATKDAILTSCYGLGLRIIGYLYKIVDQIPQAVLADALRDALRIRFKARGRELTEPELDDMVNAFVNHLHLGLAVGFVRRISNAVGSKYLSKTYLNIASAPDASTATKVIDAVIQLEHTRPIPVDHLTQFSKQIHKNVFASTVLQQLVRDHLRLYSLPERIRQQLVQAFDPKETPAQRLIAHQRKR